MSYKYSKTSGVFRVCRHFLGWARPLFRGRKFSSLPVYVHKIGLLRHSRCTYTFGIGHLLHPLPVYVHKIGLLRHSRCTYTFAIGHPPHPQPVYVHKIGPIGASRCTYTISEEAEIYPIIKQRLI